MNCKHCGAEISEGDLFCESCGMPQEEKVQSEQPPVEETPNQASVQDEVPYEVPVQQEEPAISLNTEAKEQKPKKKGKIIFLAMIAVVLVAAIILALNFTAIKVWFTRTFSSPEEIMTTVYKDSVSNTISSFSGTYEKLTSAAETGDTTVEGDVHLKLGAQLLGMVEQALGSDAAWLSDIALTTSQTKNGQYSENVLALCLGETTIISFESLYDSEANMQWYGFPELNEQMLSSESAYDIFSAQSFVTTTPTASYPSFELIENLFTQLINFLLDELETVEAETKTFTVGELSQDIYVLETKFSQETLMQIYIRLMEALKQDPEVKAYMDSSSAEYKAMLNQMYEDAGLSAEGYLPEIDMYADFVAEMDQLVAEMQEDISQAKPENYLMLYTYLNDSNEIAGVELQVFGADSGLSLLRTLTLTDGEQFAYELVIDDIRITGNGTDDELYNGKFVLAEEQEILTFEIIDAVMTPDSCKGKFRIIPGKMLMDGISGDMDPAAGALLSFANFAVELDVDAGPEDVKVKGSVLLGTIEFMSMEIGYETKPAKAITVPENSIDASNSEQVEAWLAGMDMDNVLNNLTEAGFPAELIQMIMQAVMELSAGL